MMHETSDLSFDELVDAACEELDLELNRPPPPPPPPTRREKLARWCRRILQFQCNGRVIVLKTNNHE